MGFSAERGAGDVSEWRAAATRATQLQQHNHGFKYKYDLLLGQPDFDSMRGLMQLCQTSGHKGSTMKRQLILIDSFRLHLRAGRTRCDQTLLANKFRERGEGAK
jgi:hypothetical protein